MKFFWKKKYARGSFSDSDADGLTDAEERKLGTNPDKKDSDSDGLDDYEEVNVYGTDPNNPDTDGDGMSDGKEVRRGRNPLGPGKLKDFFVPHEGNNYRPNSLHPKRLVFYTVSSLVIKAIVVILLLAMPVTAWLTPDILREESKKIIDLTNEIRKNLGLNSLSENEFLNQSALNKIQDMLVLQYFAHIGPDKKGLAYWLKEIGYGYKFAGENLAMGFSGASDVVNAWTKSKTHYANMTDPDFLEIGVAMASGSYNNRDTTLAAQYFGAPLQGSVSILRNEAPKKELEYKSEPAEEKIPTIQPPAVVEKRKSEAAAESNVLSEKNEPKAPLPPPIIASPMSGVLSKDNKASLNIFAPEAERIAIYAGDDKILETGKKSDSGYFNAEIFLEEGRQKLKIESLRGEEKNSFEGFEILVDSQPPIIQSERTKVFVDEPEGREEKIIRAVAYLSEDAEEAVINIGNYNIFLNRDESEPEKWSGQLIIFNEDDEQEIFNPVVLANITAKDRAGNSITEDVEWGRVVPLKTNLLNQYLFIKDHQSRESSYLLKASSVFFKILFLFVFISLLLSVFINLRKQRAGVIVSALSLMGFLSLLMVL